MPVEELERELELQPMRWSLRLVREDVGPRAVLTAGYDWTLENELDLPSGTLHQGRVALSREWTPRIVRTPTHTA